MSPEWGGSLFWAPVGTDPDDLDQWISLGAATDGLEWAIDVDLATGQTHEWVTERWAGKTATWTIGIGCILPARVAHAVRPDASETEPDAPRVPPPARRAASLARRT